jgi:6-phosphofructokinase 1
VDKDGVPIAAKFSKEVDSHGNVQLSGTGALGDLLAGIVKEKAGIKRVRADTFGYLQRSFPGVVSMLDTDPDEARYVGMAATRAAVIEGIPSGSIVIKRKPGKKYEVFFGVTPLKNVAKKTRCMPSKFINKAGNDVTQAFIDYARPLVGDLPKCARFEQLRIRN